MKHTATAGRITGFARRRPGALLLGAAVAGVGIRRLARSTGAGDAGDRPEVVPGLASPQTTGLTTASPTDEFSATELQTGIG